MSKDLDYEFNNFANLLHKDCMNLMECLKKQSEDNKPILYLGKHYEKVILPLEEYQKMCNRLEAIDNANPSEALKCLGEWKYQINSYIDCSLDCRDIDTECYNRLIEELEQYYTTIKQALLKAQKLEKENAKYKQLEEQIGCPLEVVFKALKNGIFTKDLPSEKIVKWYGRLSNVETEWYLSDDNKVCINLKGYKKTWWLKEDKSE